MSNEDKMFATKEAVERLSNMKEHLPEIIRGSFLEELCTFLAKRIGDGPIVPAGFVLAFMLVVEDARANKDGFTGKPMPQALVGQPAMLYNLVMSLQVPIARAAFGDEFGDLVRDILKEVDEP